MAIKVDLKKACDRLDWNLLEDTLKEIGISTKLISIIMACISLCSMKVLWNGQTSDSFTPTRGLRQGDLILQYLFVLCIEQLAHCINYAVQSKVRKPVKLKENGPQITYLFFPDDLILFVEASRDQADIIKTCLEVFRAASS